jgi:hypothetical protein
MRGKCPRDLSPALFRDGGVQPLLRLRSCSPAYWLTGSGGPRRGPVGSDDAEICAQRQTRERALSDLPQIPAPVRGASTTSQPVQQAELSVPTVQLVLQTHERGDETLPWQNDRNNREPMCGNEPREIGNRSWRTLAPFLFLLAPKPNRARAQRTTFILWLGGIARPRSRALGGLDPWPRLCRT